MYCPRSADVTKVGYDSRAEGDGAARPGRLKTPQAKEGAVVWRYGEANVGGDVDEADQICRPPAAAVCQRADEHGRDALEYHIRRDGQVDL